MQTIKTEHGTYKISDTRDAAEFLRQLAKPKKRARREKDSVRHFPQFMPGETSVQAYVAKYFELNKWTGVHQLFPSLPTTPAQCYDPNEFLCEVSHGD